MNYIDFLPHYFSQKCEKHSMGPWYLPESFIIVRFRGSDSSSACPEDNGGMPWSLVGVELALLSKLT